MTEEVETYDEYSNFDEMLNALSSLIITILFLPVVVFHSRYVYQDLYTPQRKSLVHRRTKAAINPGYKRTNCLTVSCIWFYWLALFGTALQYNFSFGGCIWGLTIVEKLGFFSSKILLYLTYIIRLHEVYGRSAYGYSKTGLKCAAFTVIIWLVILFIFVEILFIIAPHYYEDTDNKYPYYCQIVADEPWLTYVGLLIVLFDVMASITAVVLFLLPLNRVIKASVGAMDDTNLNKNTATKRSFGKMMYTGTKYKILVWSASFFTLLWILIMFANLQSLASFLVIIDFVVNPISVILMTPYYPSNRYYERICWLCIKCCDCDKSQNKYKSEAAVEDRSKRTLAELSSLDTQSDTKSQLSQTLSNEQTIEAQKSPDTSRAVRDAQKAVPLPAAQTPDANANANATV